MQKELNVQNVGEICKGEVRNSQVVSGLVKGPSMIVEEDSQPRMNAERDDQDFPLDLSSEDIDLAHEGSVISPNYVDGEDSGEIKKNITIEDVF